ncbi:hypothetical protein BC834DRAFT_925245 [Gloeopeniophorella convolvens]|nr:hypothetical protein BC834DRAFT_925245 [Gloeopeniophorella convolvens]
MGWAQGSVSGSSGGFLAYASAASPFAAVKGPALFGSTAPSTSTSTSGIFAAPAPAPASPPRAASPTPAKRTGFEAFASAASPFVARARSPARRAGSPGPTKANPFASYAAGGAQGLFGGAPAAKRARGESESGGAVLTGEEEDETVHSVRGKLYVLSAQNQWKERGTGVLRLNRRRADHAGARLVMRKDAVYAVLLNVTLFRGMSCAVAQDPRYLRFSVLAPGGTTHYNLRVASAKAAAELLQVIEDNIPHV